MNVFKALLNTYEKCEREGLVDKHDENGPVLLPIFHMNARSIGTNIITVVLNNKGEFLNAEYMPANQYMIFPVTIDSVSRTSGVSAHPLIDQIRYMLPGSTKHHDAYIKEFTKFYQYIEDEKQKEYVTYIKNFLEDEQALDKILNCLYDTKRLVQKDVFKFEYTNDQDKVEEIDLQRVYITFNIMAFEGDYDISVTNNVKLHQEYINYIKSLYEDKKGVCSLSFKEDFIIDKHRGLLGGSKIISVSNNKENYFGQIIKKGEHIAQIGYETSEKIHLMLKALLENKNNTSIISKDEYLVNWFSDDVYNAKHEVKINEGMTLPYEQKEEVNESSREDQGNLVGKALTKGVCEVNFHDLDDNSDYFIMIVHKLSKGRIAIKYYNRLKVSRFRECMNNWTQKYYWPRYNTQDKKWENKSLHFTYIISAALGVERNKMLELPTKSLFGLQNRQLIANLMANRDMQINLVNVLKNNIKHRLRYKDCWQQMLHVAYAVLSANHKEDLRMRPDEEQTRSYLYGRLLAIYEKIEKATLDESSCKTTNAEKLWTAYTNKPAKTMYNLESAIKPYLKRLNKDKKQSRLLDRILKHRLYIINEIAKYKDECNNVLDYEFIFGYYAEQKALYVGNKGE